MRLETLKDLYVMELRDLYSAEKQVLRALPKMAKAASSPDLKVAFLDHVEQTRGQVDRLETIFEALGLRPRGKTCKAMEGLIEEGKALIAEEPEPTVLDAGLISAAQRVGHYEIAGYGSVLTYARTLGETGAAALLRETLDEEAETDEKLTLLAEQIINAEVI